MMFSSDWIILSASVKLRGPASSGRPPFPALETTCKESVSRVQSCYEAQG